MAISFFKVIEKISAYYTGVIGHVIDIGAGLYPYLPMALQLRRAQFGRGLQIDATCGDGGRVSLWELPPKALKLTKNY